MLFSTEPERYLRWGSNVENLFLWIHLRPSRQTTEQHQTSQG